MDKERLEQEIECMLKYVKTLEDAKDLLAHKERLLARVLDDNKWLERDYYEIEEENENLKAKLKNLQEKEKVLSREFAIKQLEKVKTEVRNLGGIRKGEKLFINLDNVVYLINEVIGEKEC